MRLVLKTIFKIGPCCSKYNLFKAVVVSDYTNTIQMLPIDRRILHTEETPVHVTCQANLIFCFKYKDCPVFTCRICA
jgi:hypothetical protein